jgi:hypothetical protein
MRALTMKEVGFVSGGTIRVDPRLEPKLLDVRGSTPSEVAALTEFVDDGGDEKDRERYFYPVK